MINNTNVENNHVTTGDTKTVYPITFGGATDSGGLPMFKVTLTYADGSSKELVHNVDYKLVYNEVQENNTESLNKPSLIGIKFLLDEYLVAGNKLDIVRVTPFEQQIDFQIGRIDPEQVEKAFDLSVMRDQELRNQIAQTAEDVAELTSDIADVDATLKTKASKEELADAAATLNTKIDSEVSDIESKIPESASATNPLVTEAYLGDNAVKKIGDTMTGALSFDVPGTAGKDKGLIYAKTASGNAALFGAKTDDNGVLRDVAIIPKLQTEALQSSQMYASFIGDSSTPVTRIHAKKIGSGPLRSLLTIPDEAGTIARLEDVQEVDNKLAGKQDQLIAGDNITIVDNVISATGGGGGGGGGGIANVVHDTTLSGSGTTESPLGIASTVLAEIADKAEQTTVETLSGVVSQNTTNIGTLRTDVDDLGDQVNGIEGKIPESTSTTNQLVNATQLSEAVANIDALPDQTGNAGKVLMTDGDKASWQDAPAGGTKVIIKRYS